MHRCGLLGIVLEGRMGNSSGLGWIWIIVCVCGGVCCCMDGSRFSAGREILMESWLRCLAATVAVAVYYCLLGIAIFKCIVC